MNTARSFCRVALNPGLPISRCPTMGLVIIRRLRTNPEPHEIVSQIGTGSWEGGFKLYS